MALFQQTASLPFLKSSSSNSKSTPPPAMSYSPKYDTTGSKQAATDKYYNVDSGRNKKSSSGSSSSSQPVTIYTITGTQEPAPLPFVAPQTKSQQEQIMSRNLVSQNVQIAKEANAKDSNYAIQTKATSGGEIHAATTPGGILEEEYKPGFIAGIWGGVKGFASSLYSRKGIAESYEGLYQPFSRPGFVGTPNLNPTWRGTIIAKGYEPAGYRSTLGMSPGMIKVTMDIASGVDLSLIGLPKNAAISSIYSQSIAKVSKSYTDFTPTQEKYETDILNVANPKIEEYLSKSQRGTSAVSLIQSERTMATNVARFGAESLVLSGVAKIPSLVEGARLAQLNAKTFNALAVKTAISARDVEQGFVPGYSVLATRSTAKASEVIKMDLRTFATGEGKVGLGLSSGTRTLTVDKMFKDYIEAFGGKGTKILKQNFGITGGSESLGLQEKATGLIINEDIGKVFGGRSHGFIFSGGKQKAYSSVGLTRKESEGIYSFVSTKGGLKLRATLAEANFPSINLRTGKLTFYQPMRYKGQIGTRGFIIESPMRGKAIKELTMDFTKTGRPFKELSPFLPSEESFGGSHAVKQILKPITPQETKAVSSSLGSLAELEMPKSLTSSRGAYTGLGLYERTAGGLALPRTIQVGFEQPKRGDIFYTPNIQNLGLNTGGVFGKLRVSDLVTDTTITNQPVSFGQPSALIQPLKTGQDLITPSGFQTPFEVPPFMPTPVTPTGWGFWAMPEMPSFGGDILYTPRKKGKKYNLFNIAPSFTAISLGIKMKSTLKVSKTFGVTPFQTRGILTGKAAKGKYFKLVDF